MSLVFTAKILPYSTSGKGPLYFVTQMDAMQKTLALSPSLINTVDTVASPRFAPVGEDRVAVKDSSLSSTASCRVPMGKNSSVCPARKVTTVPVNSE